MEKNRTRLITWFVTKQETISSSHQFLFQRGSKCEIFAIVFCYSISSNFNMNEN